MRLIDADVLKEYFGIGKECGNCDYMHKNRSLKCEQTLRSIYDFCDAIDVQPTIEAKPVIHSHWESVFGNTSRWECKNCGRIFDDKDRHEELYCGECGARMDGDTE